MTTILVPGGVAEGSFRSDESITLVRGLVKQLLKLDEQLDDL